MAKEAATRDQFENRKDMRWQGTAILAIQQATEQYATDMFAQATLACIHAKRVTVQGKDIALTRRIAEMKPWTPRHGEIGVQDWRGLYDPRYRFSSQQPVED